MAFSLPLARRRAWAAGWDPAQTALAWLLLGLLVLFILYPLLRVLVVAVSGESGFTLRHLADFFRRPLFREALVNSLVAGATVSALGSVISLPLAFCLARYEFPGRMLLQSLAVLPLVMPPFVGAIALQQLLGRSGALNLLLLERLGFTVPLMEGLTGVILVQTLHYFPFILLNTVASLEKIDPSLEEAAQASGCHGFRLFRRVTWPLMMPGFVAGVLLVFIKVVDDLGTPLMLNYTSMLAPQAYLRVTTIGIEDTAGYVICVIMVVLSLMALWLARRYLAVYEVAAVPRGAAGGSLVRRVRGWRLALVLGFAGAVLFVALLPHLGILMLSFARVWSFSPLPESLTWGNYAEILFRTPHFVRNTMLYAALAALLDVALGTAIAFVLARGRVPGKGLLDAIATLPLAIPGVVLGVGYLRVFHAVELPWLGPLTATWGLLVVGYGMRRLPYAVQACYAALQHLHPALEESAHSLGANRRRTFSRVTLPLMTGGMVVGGLLAFVTSAVEFSMTIMLVPKIEMGPLTYGIYVYMQSAVGRGAGAALGVVAIVLVALGTYLVNRLFSREGPR